MMTSSLLLAALAMTASQAQEKRYKDTAGTFLKPVVETVRKQYEDAELVGISGRTDVTGSALCDKKNPSADGWIYHFYSESYDTPVMVAQCQGFVVGPFKEFVSTAKDAPPIIGRFTDSDEALRDLSEAGVSVAPADHGGVGRRPFGFTLIAVEDRRFAKQPLFWQVKIGGDVYMLNAMTRKIENGVTVRYERNIDGSIKGEPPVGSTGSKGAVPGPGAGPPGPKVAAGGPLGRPERPKGYTALTDLAKAQAFARQKLPGSVLMGVDGIADAWGSLDCDGPGDGWAYYFYWPRKKGIESVYACKGDVSLGQGGYIPISMSQHAELPAASVKIDSDRAMDGLLLDRGGVMNEGMGRFYTRRVPMRLYQFKTSPLNSPALLKKTLLWEVSIGATIYWIDALTGQFVAEKK